MKERIISQDEFKTTTWEGGETTELFIWPEGSRFADRDFLFRISSATFSGTQSDFSDFSGYQRYILPLLGELKLSHTGLYERALRSYEVEYFDGAWKTHSENSLDCRDFNFIYRSGRKALLQVVDAGSKYQSMGERILTAGSQESFGLIVTGGEEQRIPGGSLYLLETEREVSLTITEASTPVILTVFWLADEG